MSLLSSGNALLGSETFVIQSQNHSHASGRPQDVDDEEKIDFLSSLRKRVLSCHLNTAQHLYTHQYTFRDDGVKCLIALSSMNPVGGATSCFL